MTTERQRQFREQYRSQISPLYNGLVHIGVMNAASIEIGRASCRERV